MLKTSGADFAEYVTETYAPIRVVRCRVGTGCNGWSVPVRAWVELMYAAPSGCAAPIIWAVPGAQYYWQAWLPDGTRYVFGTDAASTQYYRKRDASAGEYGRWFLKRVYSPIRDNAGNALSSVEYNYTENNDGANGKLDGQSCASRGIDWDTNTRLLKAWSAVKPASGVIQPHELVLDYDAQPRLTRVTAYSREDNLLTSVPRYSAPNNSPCNPDGTLRQPCVFDTRILYTDGGYLYESITAYGRFWNFKRTSLSPEVYTLQSTDFLGNVPRYASGPCAGHPYDCKFDTRAKSQSGLESITAYGRFWNWSWADGSFISSDQMTVVGWWNNSNGPCYGISGTCVFDTRTFGTIKLQSGAIADVEAVTAYGKYWYWDLSQQLLATGFLSDLPCAMTPNTTACKYSSRTLSQIDGTWIDSITANGRFYNFTQDGTKLQWTYAERNQVSLGFAANGAINTLTSTAIKLDGTTQSLPATTFSYATNQNNDSLIATVNNGYGTLATYGYWEGNHGTMPDPNNPAGSIPRRYHYVNSRTVADGIGNTVAEEWVFDSADVCFFEVISSCYTGHDDLFPDARGSLVGYAKMTHKLKSYGGNILSQDQHSFSIARKTLGKETETRLKDANGTVLSSHKNEYQVWPDDYNMGCGWQSSGAWYVALVWSKDFPLGDVPSTLAKYTNVNYDCYTNPTFIAEYGYTSNNGKDDRTTYKVYRNNASAWIIGKLQRENVYNGIVSADNAGNSATPTELKARTFLCYDADPAQYCDSTALTRGQLTQIKNDPLYGGEGLIVQQAGYDALGNLNTLIDGRGNTTSANYDTTGQFLTSETNPLRQTTQYGYYAINSSVCDAGVGGYGQYGQLKCVVDPNGSRTHYVYDIFGRLTKIIRPGDSEGVPMLEYSYVDGYSLNGLAGLRVMENAREVSGDVNRYQPRISFYNGLGQLVQTRIERIDGSTQAVVNTVYDEAGRVSKEYVAADEGFTWDFSRTIGWDTRKFALTTYDALGRVSTNVSTDNKTTTHSYELATDGVIHKVIDANNHVHRSITDGLGRLATVVEYIGINGGETN